MINKAKSYFLKAFKKKKKPIYPCVREHRCKDIQPQTLEAKILAVSDSASHLTDFNYIVHILEVYPE